jgi:Kdo2-lipid IVA lauroyltransferase/acyltransferase
VSQAHGVEAALVHGVQSLLGAMPPAVGRGLGAGLGGLAHAWGLRRSVAAANLALAFPEKTERERAAILAAHYRDLGLILAEYARPRQTVYAPEGRVVAAVRGLEHLERAARDGRGAILLTGHYGNFGLLASTLGRTHPVDMAGKPIQNPRVEALLVEIGESVGLGRIRFDRGARRVFTALKENRWVMLMADQDAGPDGAFVPFFGRPTSTWTGPASISLRTGAPLVPCFIIRRDDGRHEIDVLPPIAVTDGGEGADVRMTALHTAELERQVRRHPAMWFWLHRRWKTTPREGATEVAAAAGVA